jgi:hypothetical protein
MADRAFLIEVSGDELFLRGYVEGWFAALGEEAEGIYFGSEFGLDDEGLVQRLEELLRLKREENLLIVTEAFWAAFEQALARLPEATRLRLGERCLLKEVRFPFSLTVYNRGLGAAFKTLLSELPEGAHLVSFDQTERIEESGVHVSAVAPMDHPYEYHANGEIGGEVPAAIALYRKLARYENVTFEAPILVRA